jgi:hypothetical protein
MRKKLLMLTAALSLSVAASVSAIPPGGLYIVCDSCTTSSSTVQCKCASNSVRPGYISNCSRWITDCWNGFPP